VADATIPLISTLVNVRMVTTETTARVSIRASKPPAPMMRCVSTSQPQRTNASVNSTILASSASTSTVVMPTLASEVTASSLPMQTTGANVQWVTLAPNVSSLILVRRTLV
jgi:hypothetical protein